MKTAISILILFVVSGCFLKEPQRLYDEQIKPLKKRQAEIAGEILERNPGSPKAVENFILSNAALEDEYTQKDLMPAGAINMLGLLGGIGGPLGGIATAGYLLLKKRKAMESVTDLLKITDDEDRKRATIANPHIKTPKEFLT